MWLAGLGNGTGRGKKFWAEVWFLSFPSTGEGKGRWVVSRLGGTAAPNIHHSICMYVPCMSVAVPCSVLGLYQSNVANNHVTLTTFSVCKCGNVVCMCVYELWFAGWPCEQTSIETASKVSSNRQPFRSMGFFISQYQPAPGWVGSSVIAMSTTVSIHCYHTDGCPLWCEGGSG